MAKGAWRLYEYPPSFVVGFHGCDKRVGERILAGKLRHLSPSREKWDWLGHGIYFWEGNPQRALEWAQERVSQSGRIRTPFVLGAILDLDHCLDLMDSSGLQQVKDAYQVLAMSHQTLDSPLPENKGRHKAARMLDCLVINSLHDFRSTEKLPAFDTVRAVFPEGDELYPDAGFRDKNHIQICVRNADCIKGYFRPIKTPR